MRWGDGKEIREVHIEDFEMSGETDGVLGLMVR